MTTLFQRIPVLYTKHYILRGISTKDAPNLFPFLSDADTMKYLTPHPVQTLEEMADKINLHLEGFHEKKEIPWVIIDKEQQEIIGFFRLHKLHLWHKKAEMGAVIRADYQHKGVMTELLPMILEYGFETLELNRIVGDLFAKNVGSQKLMEKFGFHQDGVLRQTDFDGTRYHDTVVYSMLRAEYLGLKGQ
jgi:[ribosomal protein S5]-alanine N-acetyltransferase